MKVNVCKWTMVALAGSTAALIGCESQPSGGVYTGTAPHGRPDATYGGKVVAMDESKASGGQDAKASGSQNGKASGKQGAKTDAAASGNADADGGQRQANNAPAGSAGNQAAAAPKAAPTAGSVQYLPTGDRGTSALMIEKIYPAQVTVGQPFDYVIKATNISTMGLSNVTVTEAVPSNFTLASSSVQGANGVYNLGSLNPGESKSIVMKGSAGAVGSINSCASATYATALCSTISVVQPALQISKTITPEAILDCQPINMTVTVKNSGSGTATNVRVMDTLPAGLTLAGGGTSFDEAVGDLAPGASKVITKELKAANTGRFENVASAKADGVAAISSEKVATVVKQPKLEIACKAGGKIMMGRKGCYEITIKNTGDAVSQATKIAVTLPAGATVASMSDGGANGAWTIGDLAPGASKTVTVCLTSSAIGSLPVSTTVTGTCAAPVSTNCAIEVIGVPDIGTLVDDEDGVVAVGNNHTYRVVVNNQGQIALTNVKTVVALPAGLEFVSSADGKLVNGKVEFNFGTLAVKGTRTATFIVKASKPGEFLVIGETTCAELKTPIRDDELTNFVEQ